MNELGARRFDRYVDTDGADLRGPAIGTWDLVTADAGLVCLRLAPRGVLARAGGRRHAVPGPRADRHAPGLVGLRLLAAADSGRLCLRPHDRADLVTTVLLIYPFFLGRRDRSRFRFPPLGPAYVAAALRAAGHDVDLLDCTFLRRDEALGRARASGARVVGVYAMATLAPRCRWFAERLRGRCDLLVAGGPLPTCEPGVSASTSTPSCAARASRPCASSSPPSRRAPTSAPSPASSRRGTRAAAAGRASRLACLPPPALRDRPRRARLSGARPAAQRALHRPRQQEGRPRRHHGHEHAGLSLCLRVLQQRRVRRTPTASARRATWSTRSKRRSPWATTASPLPTTSSPSTPPGGRRVRRDRAPRPALLVGVPGRVDTLDDETARRMGRPAATRIFFGIESGNDAVLRSWTSRSRPPRRAPPCEAAHGRGCGWAPSSSSTTPARATTPCSTRCASPARCRSTTWA